MNAEELRSLQAPLKERYRTSPQTAVVELSARGRLAPGVTCVVGTHGGEITAGLHPATGGPGTHVCSGDMLLEALVACAGVTLAAVATAMEIPIRDATFEARGELDFRGTLGVSREAPVGFKRISLQVALDTDATPEQVATLLRLTERYCVIAQTISGATELELSRVPVPAPPP